MHENKNHCKNLNTTLKIKYKKENNIYTQIFIHKHNKERFDNNI